MNNSTRLSKCRGLAAVVRWIPALAIGTWFALCGNVTTAEPTLPATWRNDATLLDVHFVDRHHGWAVGEQGAIWQTEDGGRRWQLRESGVRCRLSSVWFIDAQTGWAVGGSTEPYTHVSRGVVLRSVDGGRTWQPQPALMLPAVRQVKFFSSKRGIVLTRTSAHAPAGVFLTTDAGRTWSPLNLNKQAAWLAAEFPTTSSGMLVGRRGSNGSIRGRQIQLGPTSPETERDPTAIRAVDARRAWAVGQGGLLMQTSDAGRQWQAVAAELPAGCARFDFEAIEIVGEQIWIAGNPGSRMLVSNDGGRKFTWQETGQPLPLYGLHFVDARTGWAVGSLGLILLTTDGGATWQPQRAGGEQAAWMAVVDRGESLPREWIARVGANEGYLGVVHSLTRDDLEIPETADPFRSRREREALLSAGASEAFSAWQFPVRQRGLHLSSSDIVEYWNEQDQPGADRLEEYLVRQLRIWRPAVVVTHAASPRGENPLRHVINQTVLRAIESAADPQRFPDHQTELRLSPWKARKLFALADNAHRGTLTVSSAQWVPRLGVSLSDFVRGSTGLFARGYQPAEKSFAFELLIDRVPGGVGGRDFFSGIEMQSGSGARRIEHRPPAAGANVLQRLATRRRQVDAFLDAAPQQSGDAVTMLAQVSQLTRGMSADEAGWLLHELAGRYFVAGQDHRAAAALHLLVRQLPDHSASGHAARWLLQYRTSGEMAHRARGNRHVAEPEDQVRTVSGTEPADDSDAVLPPELIEQPTIDPLRREWLTMADEWESALRTKRPALLVEPDVAFSLLAAQRIATRDKPGRSTDRTPRAWNDATWQKVALAEAWLREPRGQAPCPLWSCPATREKPRLDGRLDDACWQRQQPISLRSRLKDDAAYPAVAYCAHDDQFLYFAIRCATADPLPEVPQQPRQRDEDLTRRDRVRIFLDIDRDRASYYQLEIDDRGHLFEACFGDATWNPQWFVANHRSDREWSCEIAIPRQELCPGAFSTVDAWAIGIDRVVPGHGFQSWQQPAAIQVVPQGFGLLMFEDATAQSVEP